MNPNFIPADLDDILFENRERRYGAFLLRKSYPGRLMGVTAIVLGCVLSFGFAVNRNLILVVKEQKEEWMSYCGYKSFLDSYPNPQRYVSLNLMPFDQKGNVPARPRKKNFVIPQPVQKEKIEDGSRVIKKIPLPKIDIADLEIGFEENEEEIISPRDCPCCSDSIRNSVVGKPEPGLDGFIFEPELPQPLNLEEVMRAILYPDVGCRQIEGIVVFRILVDKNGNYLKHKVIKEVHPLLVKECEKHIQKLKFTSFTRGRIPVCYWVNIPFRFKIID